MKMAFSNRRDIAVHEAAHAVVGDEVGGHVIAVDIGNGPDKTRRTYISWPYNMIEMIITFDPLEDEADATREAVRKTATAFVAGEVAEKSVRIIQTLSERITQAHFAAIAENP